MILSAKETNELARGVQEFVVDIAAPATIASSLFALRHGKGIARLLRHLYNEFPPKSHVGVLLRGNLSGNR